MRMLGRNAQIINSLSLQLDLPLVPSSFPTLIQYILDSSDASLQALSREILLHSTEGGMGVDEGDVERANKKEQIHLEKILKEERTCKVCKDSRNQFTNLI